MSDMVRETIDALRTLIVPGRVYTTRSLATALRTLIAVVGPALVYLAERGEITCNRVAPIPLWYRPRPSVRDLTADRIPSLRSDPQIPKIP